MTLKCSPCIRKVINDNTDQLYLESQAYRVHDINRVMICHHYRKYGHMAEKWPEKNESKAPTCGKCAGNHKTPSCSETEKKCINCMKTGNNTNIDHTTYDRHCPAYEAEITRIQNNIDHGFNKSLNCALLNIQSVTSKTIEIRQLRRENATS